MKNFTQKLLAAGACALLFTPASAQFAAREKASMLNTNNRITPVMFQNNAGQAKSGKTSDGRMQLLSVKKAGGLDDYSKYGTVEQIFSEDFSLLTTGSVGNPDLNTSLYDKYTRIDDYGSEYEISWYSFNPIYTHSYDNTSGRWGESNCYPAGGVLYMYLYDDDENVDEAQAHVNTCLIDCSKYQGDVILQFDAYTDAPSKTNAMVALEAAETNGMTATWDQLGRTTLPEVTSEKKTYTVLFRGGGKTTMFNIYSYRYKETKISDPIGNSIYIDNVKVYSLNPQVNAPTGLTMKYYQGDKFRLEWNKVEGADKYLVDVYTKNVTTNGYSQVETMGDYLYQDEEVTDSFMNVTGAANGQIYYYKVRAVKDNHVSMESNEEKRILGVVPPSDLKADEPADNKFTARWTAVPGAERYNYMAYCVSDITEDKAVDVVNADFEGMKYNEGFIWKEDDTDQTKWYYTPRYSTTDSDKGTKTSSYCALDAIPGWSAYCWQLFTDALVVDGWQTYHNKNNASLQCAAADLSKDGGKFTVTLRQKAECAEGYADEAGNKVYAHSALALFNYDEALDDYVQSEVTFISDLNDQEWKDGTYTFTKGTANSIFGVFATYAPANLYINKFRLTQNYKAGEKFYEPFCYKYRVAGYDVDDNGYATDGKEEHTDLSLSIPYTSAVNGKDIYQRIQSVRVGSEAQYYTNATFCESKWSDNTFVTSNAQCGIAEATVAGKSASVSMKGDNLVVSNPSGEAVSVYGINGTLLFSAKAGQTSVSMPAPANGTYIVKAGKQSIKVSL